MNFLKILFGWLSSGPLDRILDTVDKKVQSQTDKEKIKGDVIKAHLHTRSSWFRAGGFWLLVMWSVPFLFWTTSVVVYSVLLCQNCAFGPVGWTVAALPSPLDEWGQWVMLASIGGLGLSQLRK